MFEKLSDAEVVAAIGDSARAESVACARRLAAVAELYDRRQIAVADGNGRELWHLDQWAAVAAEVAVAQHITTAAAGAQLHIAICLAQRLPEVAALFASGALSYQTIRLIVNRTLLALDPDVLAAIDADLADGLSRWGPLSQPKVEQAIDAIVERHDPDARRRTETVARSRYIDFHHLGGMAAVIGDVYSTDATLLNQRLTALAHTVCRNDPRTIDQRRADALGALAAGHTQLACGCGRADCGTGNSAGPAAVVVHVVAEQATLDTDTASELHGPQPVNPGREIITNPKRFAEVIREATNPDPNPAPITDTDRVRNPGLILGGPLVPAQLLADLAARGVAELRPLTHPGDSPPEPGYRPSKALADFIRCRDMTCRFPGCDRPAHYCDIDHTTPVSAGGLTHASNLKCLCRQHHLLKTFWVGATGWRDKQLPDGTVEWTAPSGHTYRTQPGSKLLFPALTLPTSALPQPRQPGTDHTNRGAMMPTRRRPRDQDRRCRIDAERQRNHQARHRIPLATWASAVVGFPRRPGCG